MRSQNAGLLWLSFLFLTVGPANAAGAGQWEAFGHTANGCDGKVNVSLELPNGDLIIGGEFTTCGDIASPHLAIFDSKISQWRLPSTPGNNPNDRVLSLAEKDGRLYVGGLFSKIGSLTVNSIAALDLESGEWSHLGSPDQPGLSHSGGSGFSSAYALHIVDRSLFVGGAFGFAGGVRSPCLARWNIDSLTWHALDEATSDSICSTTANPSRPPGVSAIVSIGEWLYFGGDFSGAYGVPARNIGRYNLANGLWEALGSPEDTLNGRVIALAATPSRLFAGGTFVKAGETVVNHVAEYSLSEKRWLALGSESNVGVTDSISSVAVTALAIAGENLFVGGRFSQAGIQTARGLGRYSISSSIWTAFGRTVRAGDTLIQHLHVGRRSLYVSGGFTEIGEEYLPASAISQLNLTTGSWSVVGAVCSNGISDPSSFFEEPVHVMFAGGRHLYVGGRFGLAGAIASRSIARWDTTARKWESLGRGDDNGVTNNGSPGLVRQIYADSDHVYISGDFTHAGQLDLRQPNRVAASFVRWNQNTRGFSRPPTGPVSPGVITGDSTHVYFLGDFDLNGTISRRLMRLNKLTDQWESVPGINGSDLFPLNLYRHGKYLYAGLSPQTQLTEFRGLIRYDLEAQQIAEIGVLKGFAQAPVNGVQPFGSGVVGVGDFVSAGGIPTNDVFYWDFFSNGVFGTTRDVRALLRSVEIINNKVIVGGQIREVDGRRFFDVAEWNPTEDTWQPIGESQTPGLTYFGQIDSPGSTQARAMARLGETIFVGGRFTHADGKPSSGIGALSYQAGPLDRIFDDGFESPTLLSCP